MHCIRRFLYAMIRGNKLKVTDLQNNCNRDLNTCSHIRGITSKEKILYVLQKTSKMQFYICVSVILVSMLLFHTHTEAYQAQKVVPANPSKCSCEVTTSPHVLRAPHTYSFTFSFNCTVNNCAVRSRVCWKFRTFVQLKFLDCVTFGTAEDLTAQFTLDSSVCCVLRDLSKVLIYGFSNCGHICKLCI